MFFFKKTTKIKNLDALTDSLDDTYVYSDNFSDNGIIETKIDDVEKSIFNKFYENEFFELLINTFV